MLNAFDFLKIEQQLKADAREGIGFVVNGILEKYHNPFLSLKDIITVLKEEYSISLQLNKNNPFIDMLEVSINDRNYTIDETGKGRGVTFQLDI